MKALAYDAVMAVGERFGIGRIRKQLVGNLRGTILEIGAGTGLNFGYYSAQCSVLALEPDPSMFARAARRAGPNITLECAGDERLESMQEARFDAAVLTLVLCTVDDPSQTLSRIRRILRPGGTLAVFEHVRIPGVAGTVQDALTPLWRRIADGCRLNRETGRIIREAGFQEVGVRQKKKLGLIAGVYAAEEDAT